VDQCFAAGQLQEPDSGETAAALPTHWARDLVIDSLATQDAAPLLNINQ